MADDTNLVPYEQEYKGYLDNGGVIRTVKNTSASSTPQIPGQPTPEAPVEQDSSFLNNLAAGGYGAVNSATFGLLDFLIKNIAPTENYKNLERFKQQHQLASGIGDVAGTVGTMFIPGGALLKAAGTGAKAIGAVGTGEKLLNAANFIKTGGNLASDASLAQKLGSGAIQGLGQAAEQAIPRAITGLDLTHGGENFAQSAQQSALGLGTNLALGAGVGAVLNPLVKGLSGKIGEVIDNSGNTINAGYGANPVQFQIKELQEKLMKENLSTNFDTRVLRNWASFFGAGKGVKAGKYGEELLTGLKDWRVENGIKGTAGQQKRAWEAAVEKNSEGWQKADQIFDANKPADWNAQAANAIKNDPNVIDSITTSGQPGLPLVFDNIIKKIESDPNKDNARKYLGYIISDGTHSDDPAFMAAGRLAAQVKNKLDDYVGDVVNGAIKNDPALKASVDMDKLKEDYKYLTPHLMQEGKDIFILPKTAVGSDTAAKLAGQAVTGALIGGGGSIATQGEEKDYGKAALAGLGGALIGGIGGRVVPKAFDFAKQNAASLIDKALNQTGVLNKIATTSPETIQNIGSGIVKTAAIQAPKLGTEKVAYDKAVETEANSSEPDILTATQKLNYTFGTIMLQKLNADYKKYYATQYTPEEFMKTVASKTKNFTDVKANADILFDQEPEKKVKYLNTYDQYLKMQNIDVNKAVKGEGGLGILGIGGDPVAKAQQQKLKELAINVKTNGNPLEIPAGFEKQLAKDMKIVADDPSHMQLFLNKYGLDFKSLKDIGAIQ